MIGHSFTIVVCHVEKNYNKRQSSLSLIFSHVWTHVLVVVSVWGIVVETGRGRASGTHVHIRTVGKCATRHSGTTPRIRRRPSIRLNQVFSRDSGRDDRWRRSSTRTELLSVQRLVTFLNSVIYVQNYTILSKMVQGVQVTL